MIPAMSTPFGRKLLVASIGVATVSYVACSNGDNTQNTGDAGKDSGKDTAGQVDAPMDNQAMDAPVANLVAPPPPDANGDTTDSEVFDAPVANLVAPPPPDSGAG
jgi:hypothetical protein